MVRLQRSQSKWYTDVRGYLQQHDAQPQDRDTGVRLILGHLRVFEEGRRQDTRDVGAIDSHPGEHDLKQSVSKEAAHLTWLLTYHKKWHEHQIDLEDNLPLFGCRPGDIHLFISFRDGLCICALDTAILGWSLYVDSRTMFLMYT